MLPCIEHGTAADELPEEGVGSARLVAEREEGPRILDRALDLETVADDAGIGEERPHLGRSIGRHLRGIEAREGAAIVLALGQQPIVIEAAEKVVLIEARGVFEAGAFLAGGAAAGGLRGQRHRVIELRYVDAARRVAPPLHGVIVGDQETVVGRYGAAQVMEQLPQIGARLRFAGFRPEQKRQLLARLRHVGVQHEVRQQRLQTAGVDREHGLSATSDQQIVE